MTNNRDPGIDKHDRGFPLPQSAIQKVEELNNTVFKKKKKKILDNWTPALLVICLSANNFWIGKIQAVLALSSDGSLGSIIQ